MEPTLSPNPLPLGELHFLSSKPPTTNAVNRLDLEMPGPAVKRKIDVVNAAVKSGELKTEAIDKSVRAVLTLLEKTGKFVNPETPAEQAINLPQHRVLIRKAGAKGIVLLKNNDNILPLAKDKLKSIAALGLAKECLAHGGGSAAVNCHYRVTPWEALKSLLGENFDLRYAQGAHIFRNLPDMATDVTDADGKPGFTVSRFDLADISSTPSVTSNIIAGNYMPLGLPASAATIEGTFKPSVSGSHYLSFGGLGPSKLLINDKVVLESTVNCPDSMAFLLGGGVEMTCRYSFEAGNSYNIKVETWAPTIDHPSDLVLLNGLLGARLGFMAQKEYEQDMLKLAVDAAKDVDVAVVFVGNTNAWETEGEHA